MKTRCCDKEQLIVAAVKENRWGGTLNKHLADCPKCQEALRLATWFQSRLENRAESAVQLPTSNMMLRKAQYRLAERSEAQVLKPFRYFRWAAGTLTLLAGLAELSGRTEVLWELLQDWNLKIHQAGELINAALDLNVQIGMITMLCLITSLVVFRSLRTDIRSE